MPSRVPTFRIKIDGSYWTVKVQKPPCKGNTDGLCDKSSRIIYFHPRALSEGRTIELVAHEVTHARCFDLDEPCVTDIGNATSSVARWLASQPNTILFPI